eukprot:TRINITY_DN4937_c0_g1_i2.p1 TRINITY_DN4937_c0_g1~~TRINITY_DN4937_c0_g1_i2.p1  ORF type:complete len:122 (-),score=45.52 TRINITY_DN4937_c0_g1_i2:41-406(-)
MPNKHKKTKARVAAAASGAMDTGAPAVAKAERLAAAPAASSAASVQDAETASHAPSTYTHTTYGTTFGSGKVKKKILSRRAKQRKQKKLEKAVSLTDKKEIDVGKKLRRKQVREKWKNLYS